MCNKFLAVKDEARAAGEITERWFEELKAIGALIVATFPRTRPVESLGPEDFRKLRQKIVTKHSPSIARNMIARVRAFFTFAWQNHLIARPMRYGDGFKPPSRARVRIHRAQAGPRVYEAEQLRKIVDAVRVPVRAQVLLIVNCGLATSDVCRLPVRALDLRSGWLTFPRPKTGIPRRSPLWPETVEAVRAWLAVRPDGHSELVFVTRYGRPWNRSAVAHEFADAVTDAGLDLGSPAWLRKCCQTIGEGAGDLPALRLIMGHADPSISDHYRERIDDARLVKVTDYLRLWIYPPKAAPKKPANPARKSTRGKAGAA